MRYATLLPVLLLIYGGVAAQRPGPLQSEDPVGVLAKTIDGWHRAAAVADSAAFFGTMLPGAVYIGTDKTERWTREEMAEWAAPIFRRDTAWAFTAYDRHVEVDPAAPGMAYWDELLHTWMGVCRGSGVARRDAEGRWRIAHYHLSVTLDNDKMDGFLELTRE